MKLTLCLAILLLLCGCGQVDVARVREQLATSKQAIASLAAASAQLTAIAESTGNEKSIAMAAAAQKALDIAREQIPAMEAQLAELEAQEPGWKIALVAMWPLVVTGLRFIPGIGAAAGPIANMLWTITATKKQKQAEAV